MTKPKDMEDRPTGREDMIERVARALCLDFGIPPDNLHWIIPADASDPATFQNLPQWKRFIPQALVAVQAMREPTNEMLLAMLQAWEVVLPPEYDGSDMTLNWQAAINAALGLAQRPSGESYDDKI